MIGRDDAVAMAMACAGRGHMTLEECAWLYDVAGRAPDGPAIEIGVLCGRSVLAWACAREGRGEVYAADIKDRAELHQNLATLPMPVTVLIGLSWEVAEQAPDGLAFCFIDADHGEEGIPRDIKVWPQKMRPGGILVFHDYDVWKPTVVVKREVDAWQAVARWEDLGSCRSAKAFRRPG